jgi:hypothetical protein
MRPLCRPNKRTEHITGGFMLLWVLPLAKGGFEACMPRLALGKTSDYWLGIKGAGVRLRCNSRSSGRGVKGLVGGVL